jgi:multidrug efflux pump subunit AcrB
MRCPNQVLNWWKNWPLLLWKVPFPIGGSEKINSLSNYDRGSITLRFDKETDMEFKKFEVASIIRQVYPSMDRKVSYPLVTQSEERRNDQKTPILTYSVNGPFASFEIKKIAEDVLKFLPEPL